jgi:uncharacterized protein involved in response to NO
LKPGTPAPWRASWLLAAPHRLGFFIAAFMMATSSLWWDGLLLMRALNIPPSGAVSVSSAHALLMSLGFMPFFFAGFLFTAGPKWLGLPEVSARRILPALSLMLTGWMIALLGLHFHTLIASASLALVATGWTSLSLRFYKLLRQSRMEDRVHPTLAALACGVGVATLWTCAVALALNSELMLRAATQLGLWCFVATVFAVVSHRMIPFFSASAIPLLDAWRPMWLLWVMLGMLWFEGFTTAAELLWWPLPTSVRWAQVAFELPAAFLMLWLAVRWGLVQSLKIRLLAMLHGGFAWLGIALALNAASHTLMALTAGEMSLGLAPLHAMTMGYLGCTLFAMATRVSSGHGGRPLAADNTAWALYWVLQTAVLLRVIAALWPAQSSVFTLLAIGFWSVATVGWAVRYGRWFGRPRRDGRPG